MGFGKVAVGSCKDPEDGTPGIIYLPLDFPRAFDSDTTDVYPVGSVVPRSKFLACIYFHSSKTLQQSIDVLLEIQRESYPAPTTKPGFVMVPVELSEAVIDRAEKLDWADSDIRGNIYNLYNILIASAQEEGE